MLEQYLQILAKLGTDRARNRHPEITYHRAPHKPFLLLSVMDLIAQGRITENLIAQGRITENLIAQGRITENLIAQGRITQNLIEPSYELVDTFNTNPYPVDGAAHDAMTFFVYHSLP